MFYAALALLISVSKGAAKHSGIIALFDEHFVKAGLLPHEMSKWLHKAFDLRQIGDYRGLALLTEDQAKEVLQWAEDFVKQAKGFLSSKLSQN